MESLKNSEIPIVVTNPLFIPLYFWGFKGAQAPLRIKHLVKNQRFLMKKVLIVDDAQTVRKFEKAMIEEMGYKAEEAINGLDALEKLYSEKFDLALVDINMPKMDGYEFTRQVRKEKDFSELPIVIISTESKEIDKLKAYEAGANYFIVKPIRPETLKSLLKIFL